MIDVTSCQTFMFTRNLPKTYWEDAVLIVAYLINRMLLRVLVFKTPIEFL
jgi:hypothetical protein